jgi:serine O-acetyltransferase
MPALKQLLYSDLLRQLELEGKQRVQPNFVSLTRRLLHYRFLPILLCRLSRAAMLRHMVVISKLLTYVNLVFFGLEVSSRCEIGPGIFFPHTSGTVIGAWRIGSRVTIFQGVTLGAKELDMNFDTRLRPSVGDNVTLGAGSKILGGIHIGDAAIVGANAVVLNSVAAGEVALGVPAHTVAKEPRRRPIDAPTPSGTRN